MGAEESLHIVDALNEVSNNYAIDTDNLADILQRVSGTLGQTGTTMEEVFGLAVGGFTTLRNAEMVASGLNMISQRMRGMKEDGEAIEGLVPKIEAALQKYTNGAVSMWDKQTGELRSTYDVLNDLAKVYPSLTSAQKAYLNEVIAGDNITLYVQKCA
jgi:TP901 family phage tail tape measure protein